MFDAGYDWVEKYRRDKVYHAVRMYHDYSEDDRNISILTLNVHPHCVQALVKVQDKLNHNAGKYQYSFYPDGKVETDSGYFIKRPDHARDTVIRIFDNEPLH